MSRRGSQWRIGAFGTKPGEACQVQSKDYAVALRRALRREGGGRPRSNGTVLDYPSVFDELVIDRWLHIEQMDDGVWWMDVGGYHLWVRVDGKGNCTVSNNGQELREYGLVKER